MRMQTSTSTNVVERGQFVNARSAHEQWKSRPSDERFQSIAALHDAAQAQAARSVQVVHDTADLEVIDVDGDLRLGRNTDDGAVPATMSHWGFNQFCHGIAPAEYMRQLPASLAAACLNHGLKSGVRRDRNQLLLDVDGGVPVLRSFTSEKYERVHNFRIAAQLLDLQTAHPEWKLPMGYKDGEYGAELVPSGAYMGDRDMFVMMIDGNRSLEDVTDTTRQGLFRGFIVRNSDVGAASLTIDFFLFRLVCGNNLIWGFEHVAGFRRRHVGSDIHDAWKEQVGVIAQRLESSTETEMTVIRRAQQKQIAATKDDLIIELTPFVGKGTAEAAYVLAEKHEPDPRSVWGMVQGLTRLSQETPYQNVRYTADQGAGALMARFTRN